MNSQRLNNVGVWVGIIATVILIGIAWGEHNVKIQKLEEKVNKHEAFETELGVFKEHAARIDERTKTLKESNMRQEELLQRLLKQLIDSNLGKDKD